MRLLAAGRRLDQGTMRLSPTLAASIGLVILAFAAPGKAHGVVVDPEPIATNERPTDESGLSLGLRVMRRPWLHVGVTLPFGL